MNYGEIKKTDIANGTGVRVSLFVSGCTHHCKGCFNPETWNFEYGKPFTKEVEEELLKALTPTHITGLTLLGGEPMEPSNQQVLVPFLRTVKAQFPNKTIWCYTGYTLEKDLYLTNIQVLEENQVLTIQMQNMLQKSVILWITTKFASRPQN